MGLLSRKLSRHGVRAIQRDKPFNKGSFWDGEPLSLVTPVGFKVWTENGVRHSYRYDQVRDPRYGKLTYRCLCEKDGADLFCVLGPSAVSDVSACGSK